MSNVEFSKYFNLEEHEVTRQLLLKPRIYASLCDECDHPRHMHERYHTDYWIADDFCQVIGCECANFKVLPNWKRDPCSVAAAQFHLTRQILELNALIEIASKHDYYWHMTYCVHCEHFETEAHIAEHIMKPALADLIDERDNHPEKMIEYWKKYVYPDPETDTRSSMPMKVGKDCTMFRCLICFKYIFPDDAIEKHGDGFAHQVCTSKDAHKYVLRGPRNIRHRRLGFINADDKTKVEKY